MDVRVLLPTFIIFLGFLIASVVECKICFNSPSSNDAYRECPNNKPKCCGMTRNGRSNMCATSCLHFKCHTNYDCGGLVCCSGKCSDRKNCLPVTTWGVVGISIVGLFFVLAMFRACQLCRRRRARMQQNARSTNEEQRQRNQQPFVMSDFENRGFVTPMAPPAYDSVVQNDISRNYDQPPIYNLSLQTIINNSSTSDNGSSNVVHQVNISIRGSTMFDPDFPPSYSEVASSNDNNITLPPSYSSSQGSAESFEERTLRFSDEPPPYTLERELSGSSTREDEDSTFGADRTASEELQIINSTVTQNDSEQPPYEISNDDQLIASTSFESADDVSNDGEPQQCHNINVTEDNTPSELPNSSFSSQCRSTDSETTDL